MKRCRIFIWFSVPFLLCCSTASFKTVEYNADTGRYEKIKYSPRFQAEEELIPQKVKVLVYGKVHGKYGKEAWAAKEDELSAADFTIYFSNQGETNTNFRVNSILFKNQYFSNQLLDKPRDMVIVPKTVERIEFADSKVDRFDKKCQLLIEYTYGNQNFTKEIDISRLTTEEAGQEKKDWFAF